MLRAIVLRLRPVDRFQLPRTHGGFAYAAALELLIRIDAPLAQRVHAPAPQKPLTVSPLLGPMERHEDRLAFTPEHTWEWRLTGLTAPVSDRLLAIRPDIGAIRIGPGIFRIEAVFSEASDHPDAGQADYAGLWQGWGRDVPSGVTFTFITPTTFRVGRGEQPFPTPRWVFGSLWRSWSAFAPGTLLESREFEDALDQLDDTIVLSNWRGETRRLDLGYRKTVGFIGQFTYRWPKVSAEIRLILAALSAYAFYAGVGWQTTHGLGQVRPTLISSKADPPLPSS